MKEYKEYSKDGILLIEGFLDSLNLKNGVWKEYDKKGNLYVEERYLKGKRHGEYKCYHENGNLWCYGRFKEGMKEGEFKIFAEDGDLIKRQVYFKDQLFDEYPILRKQ